jgi:hypothetical protein
LRDLSNERRILTEMRERVQGYMAAFPDLPDEEIEAQRTRESVVLGTLECLMADDLEPALAKLESLVAPGRRE